VRSFAIVDVVVDELIEVVIGGFVEVVVEELEVVGNAFDPLVKYQE
jgi:hypothetical protein